MYIAPGQGQTAPRGQHFDVNRKAISLYLFVASFKEISFRSDFIHFFFFFFFFFFHNLIHVYSPWQGHTAPRGQSFDVNRNVLSLRSSVASFKSWTIIVSEKSIVLPFSRTKAYGKIGKGQPRVII